MTAGRALALSLLDEKLDGSSPRARRQIGNKRITPDAAVSTLPRPPPGNVCHDGSLIVKQQIKVIYP